MYAIIHDIFLKKNLGFSSHGNITSKMLDINFSDEFNICRYEIKKFFQKYIMDNFIHRIKNENSSINRYVQMG